MGIKYVDGKLYVSQKHELTELNDLDGDGVIDKYKTIATWPFGGNFPEFAFGLLYEKGFFYVNYPPMNGRVCGSLARLAARSGRVWAIDRAPAPYTALGDVQGRVWSAWATTPHGPAVEGFLVRAVPLIAVTATRGRFGTCTAGRPQPAAHRPAAPCRPGIRRVDGTTTSAA